MNVQGLGRKYKKGKLRHEKKKGGGGGGNKRLIEPHTTGVFFFSTHLKKIKGFCKPNSFVVLKATYQKRGVNVVFCTTVK